MECTTSLREELLRARAETDQLFRFISPLALYKRPVSERHRLIFYLGHVEAFDWNILGRKLAGVPSFHPTFDALFERGIDPEPGKAPADKPEDWPSEDEVRAYGLRTREWIDEHLADLDPHAVQLAVEHRYMHAETFAYLLHKLPYSDKLSGPQAAPDHRPAPPNPMVTVRAGAVTLGKNTGTFGWDNEYLAHEVNLAGFGISKFKISNGEYLQFIEQAGGTVPNFWFRDGENWMYRGMFGVVPVPLNQPVWVTWQQASSFANWRGLHLATEAQYQHASKLSPQSPSRDNFDFRSYDPIAVDASANGAAVPYQMVGNGWEWTRDVFAPFKGFQVHPLYPGYSEDFFDGKHYVMKGASPRTAALLTRPTFRNWFRPEYPHMYAGFRLVEE